MHYYLLHKCIYSVVVCPCISTSIIVNSYIHILQRLYMYKDCNNVREKQKNFHWKGSSQDELSSYSELNFAFLVELQKQ